MKEGFAVGFSVIALIALVFYFMVVKTPEGVLRESNNIEYREVCIGGKLFYATQTYYNYTALAGPIKEC